MFNKMNRFYFLFNKEDINEIVSDSLKNEMIFNNLLEIASYYYQEFFYLDYELLKKLIFKIEEIKPDYRLIFLKMVDYEKQMSLLWEDFSDKTIVKLLDIVEPKCVSYFFQNNLRARHIYKQVNIAHLVNRGVVFNIDILKSKDFFDGLKESSFISFRNNINNAEKYNMPFYIEEKLKEYYEDLISNYNSETKMFKCYERLLINHNLLKKEKKNYILSEDIIVNFGNLLGNKQDVIDYLKKETSSKLSEIIIDCLFQDNIYNVWLNINEMLRFNEKVNYLTKEKYEFYKMILNIDNVDSDKKVQLYNQLKDRNYNLIFYEDIRKLKDLSYDMIQKEMLKPIEHPEYLDKENTLKYGVDVYDLRNREYTILVRRETKHRNYSKSVRNCYSLISNENNISFGIEDFNEYLYGYNTLEKERVLHVLEVDAYSENDKEDASKYVNRIMTSKEIVNSSISYSEIQIINIKNLYDSKVYDTKKPDFLVVYETISEDIVKESKRLNIPIVIIKGQILEDENKINIKFDEDKDIYINDYFNECEKKCLRLKK